MSNSRGKRVLGMKVELVNGNRTNIVQATIRYVIKVFTLALLGIGYWPLFLGKQALCDQVIQSTVLALSVK